MGSVFPFNNGATGELQKVINAKALAQTLVVSVYRDANRGLSPQVEGRSCYEVSRQIVSQF